MKIKVLPFLITLILLAGHYPAAAQGTGFTYQGQLSAAGAPASGSYDFIFALFDRATNGSQISAPLTNSAVSVTNGLFTTALNFGGGVFNGSNYWMRLSVRTNNAGAFTDLTPLQPVSPAPYAIFAGTASNLSGTIGAAQLTGAVSNAQLVNNSILVNAGPGLAGGGAVALGGATTLSNTGVLAVVGNPDITATTVGGLVMLGDTATSTNIAGAIVKRDPSGNFSAGSAAFSGNLNLPPTTTNTGVIYAGSNTLLHAFGSENFFAGPGAGNFTLTGTNNLALGYQAGVNLSAGSANIEIGHAGVAGDNGMIRLGTPGVHTNAVIAGVIIGNGSGLTNLNFSQLGGTVGLAQLPGSNITITAGVGLGGGGSALLGGSTVLSNTGVLSLNGNVDLTVSTVGGVATLGDTATSAATANRLVKRDSTSSFSAGSITLTGNLNLPPPSLPNAGVIFSAGSTYIHATGIQNFFAGVGAGNLSVTGVRNSALGALALDQNSSGYNDSASGAQALYQNTVGYDNTANGALALFSNTTGANNTANGTQALYQNTNGGYNTATGFQALFNNVTTGFSFNTATGASTLYNNTFGVDNTATGGDALYFNTTGSFNTAGGYLAMEQNTIGASNTASGTLALNNNTIGNNNTADGVEALYNNTTGVNNIAVGWLAGFNLAAGSNNIDIGNAGLATDNNVIRLGSGQAQAFLAGVITGDGSGLTNLSFAQLSGGAISPAQLPAAVLTNNEAAVTLLGSFAGDGSSLTNVNAATLGGLSSSNVWQTGGNSGTTAGANFLGTLDNQPLELHVNGARVLRLEPGGASAAQLTNTLTGAPNLIGGATVNYISPGVVGAAIGGGGATNYAGSTPSNSVAADFGTIGGGARNAILNGAAFAVIPGGFANTAVGANSFAAGQQAQALHQGVFVWADSQNAAFASTTNDQFLVRAQGGVGINTNNPQGAALNVNGAIIASGTVTANGVQLTSDRNAKENFAPLDSQDILAKVAALPLTQWNYKTDAAGIRHVGPMAQDFQAAFGLNGGDAKHISVVDEGGVALAAIQGLNQKLEEQQAENLKLKQQNESLEKRLQALEAAMRKGQ